MASRETNDTSMPRRDFLKRSVVTVGAIGAASGSTKTTGRCAGAYSGPSVQLAMGPMVFGAVG